MFFLEYSNLYTNFDRLFYLCEDLDKTDDSSKPHEDKKYTECGFEEANLISSLCSNGMHKPVLDFDFPCQLIPSSTPGNFHLYINKEITTSAYEQLLIAFKNAGLLQKGFVDNSIKQGASFVRPPWIKKPPHENHHLLEKTIERSKCLPWCGMSYGFIGLYISSADRNPTQKFLMASWQKNTGYPEIGSYASKEITITWCSDKCRKNKYPPKENY